MNMEFEKQLQEAADLFPELPIDTETIERCISRLLTAVGENPQREGLARTPDRVARSYLELFEGYRFDPISLINDALFESDCHDPVLIRDIEFYSMCEHHMLPIIGRAHVEYIPNGKIIGLSKIPRVVDMFARRLQIQEKMTNQIANFLNILLKPEGIAVVIEGLHLCSMIRGVQKREARMTTSCMMGKYETDSFLRTEFFNNLSRSAIPIHY